VQGFQKVSRQEIHGPVGQLAAGDIHNHHSHHHHAQSPVAPPDDPLVAQCCPQCGRRTWRYSRHCIHCALDLTAWRWAQNVPIVRRRLMRAAAVLGTAGGCSALVGVAAAHHLVRTGAFMGAGMLAALACVLLIDSITVHRRLPPSGALPLH
jgi:hypothetical protein